MQRLTRRFCGAIGSVILTFFEDEKTIFIV
jgi:hypothetical protein